jgi:hypothetical protein
MLLALMSIAAILLFPSIALAEDPPSAPMTIVSEGFEGPTASYNVQSPVKRWWGPVSVRKQSGARGMWCNGSVGVSPSPFQYVSGSSGDVQFALPQTADLYSSTARFGYTMPSLGQADAGSFNMQWYRADDPLHPVRSNYSLTGVNTWSQVNSDLTWGTGGAHTVVSLSRAAGVLAFVWNDQLEGYGQPISVGEGPTIDDVLVTGYRYGPVQALTVTPREAGGLTLAWNRPAKLAGTTTPQEQLQLTGNLRLPATTSTAGIIRYPLPRSPSTYRGCLGSSPSASRSNSPRLPGSWRGSVVGKVAKKAPLAARLRCGGWSPSTF